MKIISEELTKKFGKFIALNKINLNINSSRVALLGANGSGKTTFLYILSGLSYPSKGKLILDDVEPYKERKRTIKRISFAFEKPSFSIKLKVSDIVNFSYNEDIVKILGLKQILDKKLNELSTGQQQLVNIYVALSNWNDILILDEPFANLDIRRVGELTSYLLSRRRDFIVTTHVPEEAEMIAEYFIVLDRGIVKWSGSISDLINSDIYEVYSFYNILDSTKVIYRYGNIYLIQEDIGKIKKMYDEGIIYGFRKSGLRKLYIENEF
ncbi:ABC transporter ATP-binding protein [Sulfurisphaera javensis]|uniref:ABC transporter ATP-binding protein n=1 Tax=Sulfurisphaera javensis TaxID=2049879 RepID=A0AAT9GTC8_9CREN